MQLISFYAATDDNGYLTFSEYPQSFKATRNLSPQLRNQFQKRGTTSFVKTSSGKVLSFVERNLIARSLTMSSP